MALAGMGCPMKTQDFDRSALGWVRKELDETLHQAAQALQEYSEDREDGTRLRFCATYLHQVYGTLQMLELYGVSMLADEMEQLIEAMLSGEATNAQDAEEALMAAILRCSELLERIQAGYSDSPLAVLPLINDLRAARGEKLLSEGALFFTRPGTVEGGRRTRDANANLAAEAKAGRPGFQRGLLGLIRGGSTGVGDLLATLDRLDNASTDDRCGDLWWVAGGVAEALAQSLIESGLTVQNLLRQVDQQIRRVIRDGEQALIQDPPSELFSNLLYYAGQAGPGTERLRAIHEHFGLEGLVSEVEAQASQGFVPGADILESVATAIHEDITGVKDALDLFVRSGQKDAGRLEPAGESLQRVADTLGMLGLGAPRTVIRDQVALVERLAGGGEADEQQLLDLAKSLLFAESSLDSLVAGEAELAVSPEADDDSGQGLDDTQFFDMEYRGVYRKTVSEAVADISTVKDCIVRFIEREDHASLDELPELAHRLRGALGIIGLDQAGELIGGVADYLQTQVVEPRRVPDNADLDALADAITSLEYYLEAVLENRTGREAILDVAERSIARLGGVSEQRDRDRGAEPSDEFITLDASNLPGEQTDPDAEADFSPMEMDAAPEPEVEDGTTEPVPAEPPGPENRRTGAPGGVNHQVDVMAPELDPDILEIFLEEVDEVLETLRDVYPQWRNDAEDTASLSTVRRMFHTLKGSGRMAGGLLLGELGWSVERMLNRIIDGQVAPGADVFDVIDRSLTAVPELAAELNDGTAPTSDVRWIMRKADILADPDRHVELADLPPPGSGVATDDDQTPLERDTDNAIDTGSESPLMPDFEESASGENDEEESDVSAVLDAYADIAGEESGSTADSDEPVDGLDFELPDDLSGEFGAPSDALPPTEEHPGISADAGKNVGNVSDDWLTLDESLLDDAPSADGADGAIADHGGESDTDPGAGSVGFDAGIDLPDDDLDNEASSTGSSEGDPGAEPDEGEFRHQETGAGDEAAAGQDSPGDEDPDSGQAASGEASEPDDDTEGPQPVLDPVLYDIFSNETEDHLSVVSTFIADRRTGGDHGVVSEHLTRALHTLTGSARMADVTPVALLGRKLEEFVVHRHEHGRALDQDDIRILETGVERIHAVVHALGDSRREMPGIQDLMDQVGERMRGRNASQMGFDGEGATPHGRWRVPDGTAESGAESEGANDQTFGDAAAPLEADDVSEADAGTDQPETDEQETSAPDDEADQRETDEPDDTADDTAGADDQPDTTVDQPETEPVDDVRESAPATDAQDSEEIDPDLVALFLEEAEDILAFLESSIEGWENGSGTEARITEIQRSLHTLKGGARLARFDGIGDLCHSLETLVADVEAHQVPADDRFFDLLHTVMERVADMISRAASGDPTGEGADLLDAMARIRGPAGAGTVSAAPDAADSETTQAASTDEPTRDSELVEVFLEEATEILRSIEAAQQAWADQPGDQEQVIELERALHTLKGGARMAGFTSIGDLSHALESLLNRVRDGGVPANADLFELLELTHDRLHLMREQAASQQISEDATDLLARIHALHESETDPDASDPASTHVVSELSSPSVGVPAAVPPGIAEQPVEQPVEKTEPRTRTQSDQVRVRADLLDNLVNVAGEVSIYRARLDQQVGAFRFNLTELDQTVYRLRDQLRTMEIETEAQILYRYERENEQSETRGDFDPLELDRFSRLQELSRALSESVNDLGSIQGMLDNLARESETLLLQQSRVNTELQDGLMRTRMVPFANLAPRLRRIVRQTAQELDRKAQLTVEGAQGEMDRTVLERVTAPLEHMLRNAVAHGIEPPKERLAAGKPAAGKITVSLSREGADVVLRVRDDGSGMNLEAIRRKALDRGLLREDAELTDREIMQFVLEQGFSTAEQVTQISGRGVGMDVVNAEIKQLGGSLEIDSTPREGTLFTVRLPFTLAMNQALLCTVGEQVYAIPLTSIEGVVRLTRDQLETYYAQGEKGVYHYGGQDYQVASLIALLGTGDPGLSGLDKRIPVILVQTGDHRMALQVDSLLGNREIVVKSVGPQISNVPGVFGATILADGRVVLILDVSSLARLGVVSDSQSRFQSDEEEAEYYGSQDDTLPADQPLVMVVDDSITMRKVATRLLERNHMQVVTAKDGVDAVAKLQEYHPDVMLLDIEMPRMDGYELATHMRNDERLRSVPIIMITSRTGEKHRQRAMEIGVERYLGKPYQEHDLLANLHELLGEADVRD